MDNMRQQQGGEELLPLLPQTDVRGVQTAWRLAVAPRLLNELVLEVAGRPHRILEAELYFTCAHHPDPYTHCHSLQARQWLWYFHRTGSGYKGGCYKGLDVTVGSGGAAGGVLLRSLQDLETGEVVCGPSLLVDRLMSLLKCSTVPALAELLGDLSVTDPGPLVLAPAAGRLTQEKVLFSPRVGLHMTKAGVEERLQAAFVYRSYRAVVLPRLLAKGSHLLVAALCRQGARPEEVGALAGVSQALGERHGRAYAEGFHGAGSLADVRKKVADSGVAHAMGVLDRSFGITHTAGAVELDVDASAPVVPQASPFGLFQQQQQQQQQQLHTGFSQPPLTSVRAQGSQGPGQQAALGSVTQPPLGQRKGPDQVRPLATQLEQVRTDLEQLTAFLSTPAPPPASGSRGGRGRGRGPGPSLAELREMCRLYHLPVAGTKAELRLRLDLED